jgi:dTDP-4-amino-4,6-dideoxygalactose transaminase
MIPYGKQSISNADIEAVVQALTSDWLTTGPVVEQFEAALETTVGAPCISVSSGTAALHCAYAAIGIQPGDEIITPPITFIATQAAAAFFGARIVFADVQEDTANICPDAVKKAISKKTKAIVAVDYAGHPADLGELRKIADDNGVYLIEDAAHSLGSLYKDEKVGTLADITTFSFFPTKNITTGEGGAIASPSSTLLENAKKFSRQGLIRNPDEFKLHSDGPWHQEVHEFGLNYRLPDLLCALGLSQLSRIEEFKEKKKAVFDRYQSSLMPNNNLVLPTKRDYVDPHWHLYPIRVNPSFRKKIFEELRSSGIGVQVNYFPAHLHPVFESMKLKGNFPASELFYSSQISLPMSSSLTETEQEYVISRVNELVAECE